MAKRLIKVAKELNVGTTTIVDHLKAHGFDLENKPTAQVTDEMYDELNKAFQSSIAIKEQADQLIIGTRPIAKREKDSVRMPPIPSPKVVVATPPPPVVKRKEEPILAKVVSPPPPVVEESVTARDTAAPIPSRVPGQLKILGKIDLDKKNFGRTSTSTGFTPTPTETQNKEIPKVVEEKPKEVEKPIIESKTETPPVVEVNKQNVKETLSSPVTTEAEKKPIVEEKTITEAKTAKSDVLPKEDSKEIASKEIEQKIENPKETIEKQPTAKEDLSVHPKTAEKAPVEEAAPPAPVESMMVRAETPELRGLKIIGKIDTDQFKRKRKKKKKDEPKEDERAKERTSRSTPDDKPGEDGESLESRRKRRRTRKKIATDGSGNLGERSPSRTDNVGDRGSNRTGDRVGDRDRDNRDRDNRDRDNRDRGGQTAGGERNNERSNNSGERNTSRTGGGIDNRNNSGRTEGERSTSRTGGGDSRNNVRTEGERSTSRSGGERNTSRTGGGERSTSRSGGERGGERSGERGVERSTSRTAGGNERNNDRNNRRGTNARTGTDRGGSISKKEEIKEVSQKEIDDKIKATMARISGKGNKKRSKVRKENRERIRDKQELREQEKQIDTLQVTEFVSVSELASLMDVAVTDVIMTCMNLGYIVSINQRLDAEIIELVGEEYGHEIEFISLEEHIDEEEEIIDDPDDLRPRAPIVTVMGHVDHGKTSLLDYIRSADVAGGEAGGITQHIGAYEVRVGEDKKPITFLDTPGHEAFTAMRARGAKVTDIAVIIISADDSIMPQTKEAISHAQAASVPMVFAINKIDKIGAQPEKIKQELASMNLLVEEWGGKYQSQDISAKTGLNIDLLLEKILLEAELLELKANPSRAAIGAVLEASLDKGRGYVAKTLVQTGTLQIGDPIVAGGYSGKVKAMFNERGQRVKKAGPSAPVLVLGLGGAPQAGELFKVVDSEQDARTIASKRAQISREQANRANKRISLDELGRRIALGTFKELNLIVKGDVDGSIEALSDSLIKLSVETVQVNIIHKAVGQIIESDVLLASASDAIIIGFQVRPSLGARKLAEREGVEIKTYSIIYDVIDEVKMAMEGMLEPTKEKKITGNVEIREVYKISKIGNIAGCYVLDGKITRNSHVNIIRDGIVVHPLKEGVHGELASLKRYKDDIKEVKFGTECGLTIKGFNDIREGDIVEAYDIVEIKQTLSSQKKR